MINDRWSTRWWITFGQKWRQFVLRSSASLNSFFWTMCFVRICNTLSVRRLLPQPLVFWVTTWFFIRAPHLDCLCQVVLSCTYPHHTRPSNCVPFLVHDCFCILSCFMHHTTYLSQRIQFKYEMTSINLLSTLGQVSIIENFGDHLLVRKNQYHRLSDGGCRS